MTSLCGGISQLYVIGLGIDTDFHFGSISSWQHKEQILSFPPKYAQLIESGKESKWVLEY